jgi:hypothetical protein
MSGLKHCPFCGFEEASMGHDRTVACGNCGAKGPWDKDAYDGAGDEQEMWNRRREAPTTSEVSEEDADMIARISGAVISKDWRKFAELVVEAPDIEVVGKANIAIKWIAEAAIEKLGNSGQSRHLEGIIDLAIISERNSRL